MKRQANSMSLAQSQEMAGATTTTLTPIALGSHMRWHQESRVKRNITKVTKALSEAVQKNKYSNSHGSRNNRFNRFKMKPHANSEPRCTQEAVQPSADCDRPVKPCRAIQHHELGPMACYELHHLLALFVTQYLSYNPTCIRKRSIEYKKI